MKKINLWTTDTPETLKEVERFSEIYKQHLNEGKTEREWVKLSLRLAKEHGYRNLEECIQGKKRLFPGDKVYLEWKKKAVLLFQIGKKPLEEGMNILGAHIDSPRIDLKQNPLYEESGFAYFDTHYYGGIKKYQWVALPLALHGVVVKKDGSVVEVCVGEREEDPVLVITDLLIHLAQEQMDKKARVVIEGENLDVLVGSKPMCKEGSKEGDEVRQQLLQILKDEYGMEEEDFISAEFEVVPAGKARDCGLDRSMILAYGQDDRVCAFASLYAMLDVESPNRTTCCLLADKEEIGSVGATGMHARFFEDMVEEIGLLTGNTNPQLGRRALRNSAMLSSDVSAAYDPLYANVFEKKNTAFFGRGMVLNKYGGARGKVGSNDATPEYIAKLRFIFEQEGVSFQTSEMGKVDMGGGGTIAYILAKYGMDVIDSGVPVLSMHAPFEVSSKVDIYEAYRGYKAFLTYMGEKEEK